ncbi:hypothetical protein ACMYYO_06500 [Dermacoccaceae bacterium W4C1]
MTGPARPPRREVLRLGAVGAARAWRTRAAWGVAATSSVALAGCSGDARSEPSGTAAPTRTASAAPTVHGGSATQRAQVLGLLSTGLKQVGSLWGTQAAPGLVVLIASSATDFADLTGRQADQVPAVTLSSTRLVLAPQLWQRTDARGRQVVMTHELTHVVLGQAGWTRAPRWIVEGSAEYTAYRPTGLMLAQVAPNLVRQVRAGNPPAGPPSDAALTPGAGSSSDAMSQAYGLAYAWCAFLVSLGGLSQFSAFVRAAGRQAGGASSAAFVKAYGGEPASLSSDYRSWLRSWA